MAEFLDAKDDDSRQRASALLSDAIVGFPGVVTQLLEELQVALHFLDFFFFFFENSISLKHRSICKAREFYEETMLVERRTSN